MRCPHCGNVRMKCVASESSEMPGDVPTGHWWCGQCGTICEKSTWSDTLKRVRVPKVSREKS